MPNPTEPETKIMSDTDTTASNGDQILTCRDCRNNFPFTVGEQLFYAQREFKAPARCKACRDVRKAQGGGSPQAQPQPVVSAPTVQPETYTKRDNGGGGRKGGKRRRDEWDD